MKPCIVAAVATIGHHALAAGASLSSADIQAEIERAAKEYRGDFPRGVAMTTRHYTRYAWAGDDFPCAEISVKLAVPRPPQSEMLIARPDDIQSFGSW